MNPQTVSPCRALWLGALLLVAPQANGATGTWLGVSGDWSAPGTWSGGAIADGTDSNANFSGVNITADQAIHLDTNRTIGNITFTDLTTASHSLTISGANVLTLDMTTGVPIINVSQSFRSLTISSVIAGSDGLQKNGAGELILTESNTYTGITTISSGTLEVTKLANGDSNSGIGASSNAASNLVLASGAIFRYTGSGDSTDRGFTLGVLASIDASGTGAINFTNTATPAYGTVNQARYLTLTGSNADSNTIAAALTNNGTASIFLTKSGIGTWVLSGANDFSGSSSLSGGGRLVLDYTTQNNNKLSDSNTLSLGETTLELRGGTHSEVVSATTLTSGASAIVRSSGSSTFHLNAITRGSGGTLSFSAASIATTDTLNNNSILGGWATIGNDWALNSTDAADGVITALSSYATFLNNVGSSTANYLLNGSDALAGAVAVNTLKITSSDNNQALDLGVHNLTVTSTDAKNLGGLMYAGGSNNLYAITGGGGRIVSSTTNQELLFVVNAGTLSVSAFVGATSGSSSVTKSGAGRLIISSSNSYTGAVRVNEGVLQLASSTASGTTASGITVQNGAALELANNIAVGNEALSIIGTGVSNGGALRNVAGTSNSYDGLVTIGTGGARINSDAGGTLTLTRGVATASNSHVTFGGAGNTTVSTFAISGVGRVIKDGAGTLSLRAVNTYTGTTTINGGTLAVDNAGSINTSSITINAGGTLRYNSSVALTMAPTLNGVDVNNRAVLGGSGTINVAVTLDSLGDTLSPGNSPGVLSFGVSQIWNSFSYDWELNDWANSIAGTDMDQVAITGTLNLTGASGAYTLNLLSLLESNLPGNVSNFVNTDHTWTILTTTGGITGFDANEWTINDAGFTNNDTGNWSLTQVGSTLVLNYSSIPEPSTFLLGGLSVLLLFRRRR